jgi:cation diffusion facilitator family transporter
LGLGLVLIATAINGGVAWVLLQAGQRLHSITLRADAHHLLTDVWTSAGVVVGILLVNLTGWLILDPLIAIAVALNIIWTGLRLLRETASGLLDRSLPKEEQQIVFDVLGNYHQQGIVFHALRSRVAGSRRFISLHILVPGGWTVQRGHDLCEAIEEELTRALPKTHVFTHLEPLEDPVSWRDQTLN